MGDSKNQRAMKSTTHYSDLNELACGFVLNNEVWWNDEAHAQFDAKVDLIKHERGECHIGEGLRDVTIQVTRGKVMAEHFRAEWLASTGKILKFEELHWCARNPSAIFVGCSAKHPADLLLKLRGDAWLGI